jgi:hypothetical protein
MTFAVWKELYAHLFTKYMDGNIKYEVPGKLNPKVEQPGYTQEWYRMIVKETGTRFLIPGESKY